MTQIDTSNVDAYRQGVEIVEQKHFDAGLVKIWSGEKNSISLKINFGEEVTDYNDVTFVDRSYSNPLQLSSHATSHITTYPVLYDSNDYVAVREIMFDGVLEPLNIRDYNIYLTSDALGNIRGCNGDIESGNVDSEKKSDLLLSKDKYFSSFVPYDDVKTMQSQHSQMTTVGRFLNNHVVEPFFDDRLILNFGTDNSRDSSMNAAVSLMSSSAENYVKPGERSMPTGFVYENCLCGTDSIAFGGTGY